MFRRGSALVGGVVLSLALVGPVLADTIGGDTNLDIASGWDETTGTFVDLIRDNLVGETRLYLTLNTDEAITCIDGSAGSMSTRFSGSGVPNSSTFGRSQSSASATGIMVGTRSSSNTCNGTNWQSRESHQISVELLGSRVHSRVRTRTTTQNPDGTRTVLTVVRTDVTASGTVTVDGTPIALLGRISSLVATARTH